jgi:very-short-patch-repair endonuclease
LAVHHPEPERGYILGVECDGATHHSRRSARARDVWRQDILARQGWTIHRIWSTRWWDYREQEVERLKIRLLETIQ